MMEIVWQYLAIVAGLFSGYLWTLAHDRRKAVDWLVNEIERHRKVTGDGILYFPGKDAAGRVITRSVERATKENHEH